MFLLALAMQIILPINVMRATAAMLDVAAHGTICSATATDETDRNQVPGGHTHIVCAACQVVAHPHAGAPPATVALLPPVPLVLPPTGRDPSQSVGPRGPPHVTPPARAPPILA